MHTLESTLWFIHCISDHQSTIKEHGPHPQLGYQYSHTQAQYNAIAHVLMVDLRSEARSEARSVESKKLHPCTATVAMQLLDTHCAILITI